MSNNNIIIRDKGGPHINEIIDIEELTELFQSYSDITGMVTALLDLEGEILIATNWQDSCTQFHRESDVTRKRCHESDTSLAGSLSKGDKYNVYRCRNGLVDVATPVIVNGRHMANFFTGQFFIEKPDVEYFLRQAEEAGFEEEAYLEAIAKVPVYDEATIKSHMAFLVRIAEMIGASGAANLRVLEANKELENHRNQLQSLVDERTAKLNESLRLAEAANLAKSKFLSNMSHELRTPLNAVLGYSEILRAKEKDADKKQYLESIHLAGKGLLNLINSVLDLSKIEAGKMPVQKQPMSMQSLLHEIGIIFKRQAAEKDLDLTLDVSSEVPGVISFDETKLRQILMNLVGNALKFTDNGYIKVHCQAFSNDKNDALTTIILSVSDTGKGISSADQPLVLKAFEQATGQKLGDYGGTGLGLALTKQLVDLLGGDLTLESTLGRGSTFQCRFDGVEVLSELGHKGDLKRERRPGSIQFSPATILVVDDHQMNRDLLVTYLDEWRFKVLLADNGERAIALAQQHGPDLIFMDMKMPVMDGYEATQRLKSNADTKNIPVVAATASALMVEKKKILEVTDGYLSKPITYTELVDCLVQFIPQESKKPNFINPTKILIVDDDDVNRFILSSVLEDWENTDIDIACTGREAVDACCQAERPEIVFMDCEMPGMDGIEAARKIRDWELKNCISSASIYLVTAHTIDEMKERGCDTLFNGYLNKPFEVEDVAALLGVDLISAT